MPAASRGSADTDYITGGSLPRAGGGACPNRWLLTRRAELFSEANISPQGENVIGPSESCGSMGPISVFRCRTGKPRAKAKPQGSGTLPWLGTGLHTAHDLLLEPARACGVYRIRRERRMRQSSLVSVERAAPEPEGTRYRDVGPQRQLGQWKRYGRSRHAGNCRSGAASGRGTARRISGTACWATRAWVVVPAMQRALASGAAPAATLGRLTPRTLESTGSSCQSSRARILDPPDDEDSDLAFIDDIQAEDLPVQEDGEEGEEDEPDSDGPAARRSATPPGIAIRSDMAG